MEANRGDIFIEGIDVIIKRDLDKHKSLLERNNMDIQALEISQNNEVQRRKYYIKQKGKRNFDDVAMDKAIEQMRVNITQIGNSIKKTKELRRQNTHIVDTLTGQLDQYYKDLVKSK